MKKPKHKCKQLTASFSKAESGCSEGVAFWIAFRRRGYLTRRDLGRSRYDQRSSFRLKGDSKQRCRKSCTRGRLTTESRDSFASAWLAQYSLYGERVGN